MHPEELAALPVRGRMKNARGLLGYLKESRELHAHRRWVTSHGAKYAQFYLVTEESRACRDPDSCLRARLRPTKIDCDDVEDA